MPKLEVGEATQVEIQYTIEEVKSKLVNWLNKTKFKQDWAEQISVNGGMAILYLYTNENMYRISASVTGYLGCVVTSRKSLPGESWLRSRDLADGRLNDDTWQSIIMDILGHEILNVDEFMSSASLLSEVN